VDPSSTELVRGHVGCCACRPGCLHVDTSGGISRDHEIEIVTWHHDELVYETETWHHDELVYETETLTWTMIEKYCLHTLSQSPLQNPTKMKKNLFDPAHVLLSSSHSH
jgi:hypothetical protein